MTRLRIWPDWVFRRINRAVSRQRTLRRSRDTASLAQQDAAMRTYSARLAELHEAGQCARGCDFHHGTGPAFYGIVPSGWTPPTAAVTPLLPPRR